jgi:hypothetical protein
VLILHFIDLTLLLYITAIRPNIAFRVSGYAIFQYNIKESHFTLVKRILKYLNATIDYGQKPSILQQTVVVHNFFG